MLGYFAPEWCHSVSANVLVKRVGKKARDATVTKAHDTLENYDILYKDGTLEKAVPVSLLRDKRVCGTCA